MKVVVKFDKMWPISEIENYIANPKDEKYSDMRDDVFLELLACAEYYAAARKRGDNDVQVECMNEYAASDIASGIEDYFYQEMYDGYSDYYTEQIHAYTATMCQKAEEQAAKPVEAPAESPKLELLKGA